RSSIRDRDLPAHQRTSRRPACRPASGRPGGPSKARTTPFPGGGSRLAASTELIPGMPQSSVVSTLARSTLSSVGGNNSVFGRVRMPFGTMRFSKVLGHDAHTAPIVLVLGHDHQMARVDTGPVPAQVVDVQAVGDWLPVVALPRHPMNQL